MVKSDNWFVNIIYWWTKATLVDPPMGLLGLFLGIFGEWQFTLTAAIETIGIFKYPELEGAYNKAYAGNTIKS